MCKSCKNDSLHILLIKSLLILIKYGVKEYLNIGHVLLLCASNCKLGWWWLNRRAQRDTPFDIGLFLISRQCYHTMLFFFRVPLPKSEATKKKIALWNAYRPSYEGESFAMYSFWPSTSSDWLGWTHRPRGKARFRHVVQRTAASLVGASQMLLCFSTYYLLDSFYRYTCRGLETGNHKKPASAIGNCKSTYGVGQS